MGGKQVSRAVQLAGHGHVCRDKVVEAAPCTRCDPSWRETRLGVKTLDGIDVVTPLRLRERRPEKISVNWMCFIMGI